MIQISLTKSFGEALAAIGREVSDAAVARVEAAVESLGEDAMQQAKVMALSRLDTTAQQYVSALDYRVIAPGVSVITLDPSAAFLETGYAGFDMKKGLLSGPVVPRGVKGIHKSKAGYLYRSIPFSHDRKGPEGSGTRQMWSDLRQMKKVFGVDKTTTFPSGAPVLGKVAVIGRDTNGRWSVKGPTIQSRDVGIMPWSPNLAGVVKFQYATKSGNIKSHYMTFRTVSSNPAFKDKWLHPGFDGVKIFPQLEEWALSQLKRKVDEALRG